MSRRQYLLTTVAGSVVGLTGCSGGGDSADTPANTEATEEGCSTVTVEGPDGTYCVTPVDGDQSVQEYYGYGRGGNDSASTPDELEQNDATVTFVYRNTESGQLSLVTINGDNTASSDGGGNVAMTFEGVSGYGWQVQDGPPGPGTGDVDPYGTPDGEFGSSESVIWGWNDNRTDGGAIGPLGDSFDVTVRSLASGTVNGQTQARQGLDRWLLVDGDEMDDPIELASFGDDTGDIAVRVRRGNNQ